MSRHHLLYLTTEGLRWYRRESGQPVLHGRFDSSDEGVVAFRRALEAAGRGDRFWLLVDVADEGFNFEPVPSIRGRDRSAMLQRKLAQQFYGSPYTTALSLGREKQGRRDERMLFAALTRPAQLDPWIGSMVASRIRVRGVHSAPFLLDRIMARARLPARDYLLVNFSPAGIRQTYFNRGRLRFSRLSGSHDRPFELSLETASEEIRKTLAYLAGQRLTRRGELLPVVGLVDAGQFDAFANCVARAGDSAVSLAEIGRLRASYGAPGGAADSLPLLLDALDAEPLCEQIGGSQVLREQQIHQVRKGLYLASLAILSIGAGIVALSLFESSSLRKEVAELDLLVKSENARHDALLERLPPMPAPIAQLRALVDQVDVLENGQVPPLAVYRTLSAALDQLPDVRLSRLEWRLIETPEPRDAQRRGEQIRVVALLNLPARMAGDQRGMVDVSERFVRELDRAGGTRVTLTRRPIDLQSTGTLRIREGDEAPNGGRAPQFEVEFRLAGSREG